MIRYLSNRNGSRKSRTDFRLVSGSLDSEFISADVLATPLTDYNAILISINFVSGLSYRRSSTYWKINSSLLDKSTKRRFLV